jgi:glyoxylase-like metal-dependent hydrolase (beta-lactamase superfamily II)
LRKTAFLFNLDRNFDQLHRLKIGVRAGFGFAAPVNRRALWRFVLAAPICAAAVMAPAPAALQPVGAGAIAPFIARQLAPGVHLLAVSPDYRGGALPGNVTIVEQADGIVLIDSGLTVADGRRVAAYVRSLTAKPVKAVVYTHWHGDHPLGMSGIVAQWPGIRIISTAGTLEALRGPAMRRIGLEPQGSFITEQQDLHRAIAAQIEQRISASELDSATRQRFARIRQEALARIEDYPGTYLVLPNETFTDELLIDDPVRPIRLMFLGRANTAGDAIAWLPTQRIVVTGDVVVSPVPFGFDSYPGEWIAVLEQLKAMDFVLLVPGHGEPQSDRSYLDRLIGAIQDVRTQVGPLASQGLSLEAIGMRLDRGPLIAIFGDTPQMRSAIEAFWLTPMVSNAYREARGIPIGQGDSEP